MTSESLGKKSFRWDMEGRKTSRGNSFSSLHQKLRFLAQNRFDRYLVTSAAGFRDFEARLDIWIEQVSEEDDQRVMLELASILSFIGDDEVNALCKSAFCGPITRWVIDQCKLDFSSISFDADLLDKRGAKTLYVAATDSFPIHDFYKLTATVSHAEKFILRSFWKTGGMLVLAKKLKDDPLIERIVILEDFVGTGEQTLRMVSDWVVAVDKPVLFCPLVICPEGAAAFSALGKSKALFSFEPVIHMPEEELLNATSVFPAGSQSAAVKALAFKLHKHVEGDGKAKPPPYSAYGFPPPLGTGCPVVLRGNVPDNALPIIHFKSNAWEPLFPRKPREL